MCEAQISDTVYGVSSSIWLARQTQVASVTRTSLFRMLLPVACALWARFPFALPLDLGG